MIGIMIRFMLGVLVVVLIQLVLLLTIRSKVVITPSTKIKIDALYSVGEEMCKDNNGLNAIYYNTILRHKIICNEGTTVKYKSKMED